MFLASFPNYFIWDLYIILFLYLLSYLLYIILSISYVYYFISYFIFIFIIIYNNIRMYVELLSMADNSRRIRASAFFYVKFQLEIHMREMRDLSIYPCANSLGYFHIVRAAVYYHTERISFVRAGRIDGSNLLRDILHFACVDHAQ